MRIASCALALPLALLLPACGEDPRTVTIEVIPGHEADAFHAEPAVVTMRVGATDPDGASVATAEAAPGGELDFGELPADVPLTFEIHGFDAGGAVVVRGRSIAGIALGQLTADVLPLFAQRLGAWSRPPGDLPSTRVDGVAVPVGDRFLALTGGSAGAENLAGTLGYDLLGWFGAQGIDLPRAARSAVPRGDALLVINDAGATWVDFAADTAADVSPPAGLASFADVAGGRTIDAPDGRSFVVGATRAAPPTTAILVIEPDGTLRAATSAPRAAAAAAWVDGVGLVIAGGSATDPGVEVLAADGSAAVPRPFPPDATTGAGAIIGALGDVVLIGGALAGGTSAPTRSVSPTCATDCAATPIDGAALPEALTAVAAYALPGGRAIAIGAEAAPAAGLPAPTRTFLVDLGGAAVTELPLREPRRGAAVTRAPHGTLALMGGVFDDGTAARTIEMLFPE